MKYLLGLLSLFGAMNAQASYEEFKTDGCSKAPDGILYQDDILHCCVIHDQQYFMGGSRQERKRADVDFKQCIEDEGYVLAAELYYNAVRLMGTAGSGFSFRWGYGHSESFHYRHLSANEHSEALDRLNEFDCFAQVRQLTKDDVLADYVCIRVEGLMTEAGIATAP